MSEFKTTPMLNSWELRIKLLEEVIDIKDAEIAALRAELADLKDGLTAAHMDGFASGKAEAKEMLRKREGQLEELRAEVKAYREVEDSLQKEIKRLDKEVASLTQELEEARSMIQWERGAKNGAYELIEQQDKLKAENAALREEAALYQKEWAILRAEVERFRAENAQLKCNFAPILHFAKQEQEKRGEPSVVIDSEGIPIENAVLRRNYITLRSQLEQAEKELAELQGKRNTAYSYIEDVLIGSPYEWAGKRLLEMIGDKK